MKRIIAALTIVFLCITAANAQTTTPDSITSKKVFGGYQYFQDGKMLTLPQLTNLMKTNTEAYKLVKSAIVTNGFLSVLSYAGGFCIGYPIGQALGGGEPVWELAAVGAGLIAVAIPIANGVTKKMNNAVEVYNRGVRTTSFWDDKELKFQLTGNGLGLALRF